MEAERLSQSMCNDKQYFEDNKHVELFFFTGYARCRKMEIADAGQAIPCRAHYQQGYPGTGQHRAPQAKQARSGSRLKRSNFIG